MQFPQPVQRNLQLHPPRRIGLDQVHKLPRNHPRRNPLHHRPQRRRRNHSPQQPPHRPARAHIHRGQLQHDVVVPQLFVDIDVVHPHHLAAVHVNDLLIEQVALQQQHALAARIRSPIRSHAIGAHASVHRLDGLDRQQPFALARLHHESRYAIGIFLRRYRNLAHFSHGRGARRIVHRCANKVRKCKRRHHCQYIGIAAQRFSCFAESRLLFIPSSSPDSESAGEQRLVCDGRVNQQKSSPAGVTDLSPGLQSWVKRIKYPSPGGTADVPRGFSPEAPFPRAPPSAKLPACPLTTSTPSSSISTESSSTPRPAAPASGRPGPTSTTSTPPTSSTSDTAAPPSRPSTWPRPTSTPRTKPNSSSKPRSPTSPASRSSPEPAPCSPLSRPTATPSSLPADAASPPPASTPSDSLSLPP